jgi:hypothetical protein
MSASRNRIAITAVATGSSSPYPTPPAPARLIVVLPPEYLQQQCQQQQHCCLPFVMQMTMERWGELLPAPKPYMPFGKYEDATLLSRNSVSIGSSGRFNMMGKGERTGPELRGTGTASKRAVRTDGPLT